jgi:multidrug efflux pump subunit AcrB
LGYRGPSRGDRVSDFGARGFSNDVRSGELLSGLGIFFQMPRRMMPYVKSPIVGVVSMMPGLSAEEMKVYFSKPIEERMVDLKNVHFVRSTSEKGFSIVTSSAGTAPT